VAGTAAASGTAVDAALVRLRLLGEFRLTIDGDERSAGVPARAPSLLAYLILRPGSAHPRQRIAHLLWPESTDGQARTNLRNVLHHLRRSAPPLAALLEIGPGSLRWVGGPGCRVDLIDFLGAIDAVGDGSSDQREALHRTLRCYQGDLLPDCPDEWLVEDRARLRERHLDALRRLVALMSTGDAGTAPDALAHARELVRRDPLNEEHHRLLITAYRAAGDRAGAVRAYHDCVTVLRQELGIAPSAATRSAYTRLIAETTDRTISRDGEQIAPFVGRVAELAELNRRWREAPAGGPALVLVTGEPGIGKTRLVEELAARCARQGALVVSARCYAGEGELGYGAVIDWLRSPALAESLRRLTPGDRRQLARLMPELAPDGAAMGPGRSGEMDRLLLFDAIGRVLTGGGRPLLLVLDDAQWCDRPSLHLMHYLIRSAPDRPVLVAATARREELDDRHPLSVVRQQLTVLDRAVEIGLHRLTIDETATLASSLTSIDINESSLQRLHAQAEGNPLFVVETIRAGWTGAGDVGLTPRLQSVIAGRLQHLSVGARELVEVAAIIGRAFTADLLGRAAGRDELTVVRGLDELWRRGVLVNHGVHEYDFSHGRIRDVAYDALSPAARQGWHVAVARALAASPGLDTDAASGQIAAHFDQAGRVAEAIDWYERAAVQALRRSAHAEAYGLLKRALLLARGLPPEAAAPVELRLLAMTPPVLGGVDGYASDRLSNYQRRARALAARLGVEVPAPLLRSSVMDALCRDEFSRAADGAAQLLALAQQSGDGGLAIESRYLMGIAAFWAGDLSTAATRFRTVVAEVDEGGRAAHLVRFGQDPQVVCLSRLANALFFLGDAASARSTMDEALELAERVGDRYSQHVAHVFAAVLAADLGDAALMVRAVEAFRRRPRSGLMFFKSEALLGYVDVIEGRAAAGIERIQESVRGCGPRNPAPGFIPTLHRLLVGAYDLAGDAAGALAAADRALALGGTRLWEPELRRVRQRALAVLGQSRPATPRKRSANAQPSRLPA
jgi:DNA-binding SARP family transcriptional activator/tetratricopeptide (TPR) repeat protein